MISLIRQSIPQPIPYILLEFVMSHHTTVGSFKHITSHTATSLDPLWDDTPVVKFPLHRPKLEMLHAGIWQAVYFSLNRGRCGSVMFASHLRQWCAPCRGSSAPRQWWEVPSCHTTWRLLIWFELAVFILFNRISSQCVTPCCLSLSLTECIHAGTWQGVHHGFLNWFCVDYWSLCCREKQ